MADVDDIQPLVCDNGTGMVKVMNWTINYYHFEFAVCDRSVLNTEF